MDAARLRRDRDIAAVRARGPVLSDRHLSVRALPNDLDVTRIAIVAPARELGGSVARNRARRRVREALRGLLRDRPAGAGSDLVVSVRRAALEAGFPELRRSVERALDAALGDQP